MLIDESKVKAFLPHGDSFRFIDTVEDIQLSDHENSKPLTKENLVGSLVIANFFTREDLPLFKGHFPGNPILPGVIQLEMMAQAAGFALTQLYDGLFDGRFIEMALLGINNSKFRKPILPNMNLKIYTKCTKIRGSIMTNDAYIEVDGVKMSEASILALIKW